MKNQVKNRRTMQAVVFLAFLVMFVSPVFAVTITFEDVAPTGGIVIPVTPYSEGGFTLTNGYEHDSDGIFSSTVSVNSSGSDIFGWCGSCGSTPITLTLAADDGSLFSIESLDATNLAPGYYSTGMGITVTGNLLGGGTVTQDLIFVEDTFTTFYLSSDFADLTSLQIQALFRGADLAMDNIVLNNGASTVPEPSTMILLFSGLAAMAGLGRRKVLQ